MYREHFQDDVFNEKGWNYILEVRDCSKWPEKTPLLRVIYWSVLDYNDVCAESDTKGSFSHAVLKASLISVLIKIGFRANEPDS